jgi:transposase
VLADLVRKRMRPKFPELTRALHGRFGNHHGAMLRLHLAHITISTRPLLMTITGVGKATAEVLSAEIGVDMSAFPTAAHLASWAGVCPGNNESAGKRRSGRTNPASPWLTGALIQASWAAARSKDTWLSVRFWRLARRIFYATPRASLLRR